MAEYYEGGRALSTKDANGNDPEIIMSCGNRTAGKTTFWGKWLINKYKRHEGKFMLLYRFDYELDDIEDKFFKDLHNLFFENDIMTAKNRSKGMYVELFLNGESCGYAVAINKADIIKKIGHLFIDVERMLFDEFQSETNHYCSDEVKKLKSIHTTVARGKNKQVRFVPLIMVSNCVSIINPYFTAMGISNRLRSDTKILRGDGFVLEQVFNENASKAQKESGFNRAFGSDDKYLAYSAENVYLNDNMSFIEKPEGRAKYIATIKCDGKDYAIKEYAESGYIYCDKKPDYTFPLKITVTTDDHSVNYVMLRKNDFIIQNLRYFFEHGCFRFADLQCKDAVLKMLSY